jgi:hypothetical protein
LPHTSARVSGRSSRICKMKELIPSNRLFIGMSFYSQIPSSVSKAGTTNSSVGECLIKVTDKCESERDSEMIEKESNFKGWLQQEKHLVLPPKVRDVQSGMNIHLWRKCKYLSFIRFKCEILSFEESRLSISDTWFPFLKGEPMKEDHEWERSEHEEQVPLITSDIPSLNAQSEADYHRVQKYPETEVHEWAWLPDESV